jgi:RHS repeat-associated protein
VSATYCYDHADRLTSTTAAGYTGSIVYDGHGSATSIAGETHGYDVLDRHLTTVKGALTVTYVRDALNRIVSRSNGSTTVRYAFSGPSDSPAATLTTANVVSEKFVGVLGGVGLTKRATGGVWSFPNLHGDVVRTIDDTAGGVVSPAMLYEPFGVAIGTTSPDNSAGSMDFGWLGSKYRPSEAEATLAPMIEMGERQYSAVLGRFIEVDPVEGGSLNDYEYGAGDGLNNFDLDGRCLGFSSNSRSEAAGVHYACYILSNAAQIDRNCSNTSDRLGCWKWVGNGMRGNFDYVVRTAKSAGSACVAGAGFASASEPAKAKLKDRVIPPSQPRSPGNWRTRAFTAAWGCVVSGVLKKAIFG